MTDSSPNGPEDDASLPLQPGSKVKGFRFQYTVLSELGKGGRGHAFLVKAEPGSSDLSPPPEAHCVLKTVRVDMRRSPDEDRKSVV